jgi:predicted Zn-dependent protease
MTSGGSIQERLSAGMRARQSGELSEARRHFEAVLAIDPTHPLARNVLGLDALANGDPRAAADHLEQACRADPNAAELWLNLASAHAALGDNDSERAALERSLGRSEIPPALIRLAQLHERLCEEAPAAERWGAVLALTASLDQSSGELNSFAHAREYVGRQR